MLVVCKNRAMNPAHGDIGDIVDTCRVLIWRKLLQVMDGSKNPAYRLVRHF